jgi:AraC-like DNA-binding protein
VPADPFYFELTPGPPLSAVVRRLWVLDLPAPHPSAAPERIVPDGCCEIVLTLLGEVRGLAREGGGWSRRPADVLVGQMSGATTVQPVGAVRLVGIRLHPASLPDLVGFPADDCTDGVFDLADVAPALGARLRDAVGGIDEPRAAIDAIVPALARWIGRRPLAPPIVGRAVELIRAMPPGLTVGTLARELGWSERRLQRAFAAQVGIPPKLLYRITRVQRAILRAEARPGDGWAAVAAYSGYADQPHLVREFVDLAGCLPTSIRSEPAPLRDRLLLRD